MLGLILTLLAVDTFLGGVFTQGIVAASFFPAFYRSPGGDGDGGGGGAAWSPDTKFEKPEEAVEALSKAGYKIRTAEQEAEFLTNATSSAVTDARKEERKLFLGTIDETVEKLTGVKRDPTIKTTDYLAKAVTTIIENKTDLEKQVAELKEKGLAGSDVDKELKAQLETVKAQLKTVQTEKDTEIAKLKGERWGDKVNTAKAESMAQILPKLVKVIVNEQDMTQSVVNDVLADFDRKYIAIEHNGTIIYHNRADDTPVLDTQTGNHLSTSSLLEKAFDHMVDKGRKQSGAGGANSAGGDGTGTTVNVPDGISTRVELNDYFLGNDSHGFTWEGKKLTGTEPIFHKLIADNTPPNMPLR